MIVINDKLVAYRPLLAEKTIFGYVKSQLPNGKYLIDFNGTLKELDKKEFTVVWNKKQEGYRE